MRVSQSASHRLNQGQKFDRIRQHHNRDDITGIMELIVKDHMVSVNRFAKISDTATFSGAVMALECAHDDYLAGKREQEILLVTDGEGRVIGKLSPNDMVRALTSAAVNDSGGAFRGVYMVDALAVEDMTSKGVHWTYPLEENCERVKDHQIQHFITLPDSTEIIGPEENLNSALHRFSNYNHEILFVMESHIILGIIRFSDMFKIVAKLTKSLCRI